MEMEELAQKKIKLGSMAHKTVKDLLDGYIDMLSASGSIESSTVYDYRGAARLVERRIGGIEFDSLDVTAAQNWINRAVEEGYKPSTIRKSVTLLKAAYRDAVGRLRVIDYSPSIACACPKPATVNQTHWTNASAEDCSRFYPSLVIAPRTSASTSPCSRVCGVASCLRSGGATLILNKRCCTSKLPSGLEKTGITRRNPKTAEVAGAFPCPMKSRGSLLAV